MLDTHQRPLPMPLSNCADQGGYIKLARWGNILQQENETDRKQYR